MRPTIFHPRRQIHLLILLHLLCIQLVLLLLGQLTMIIIFCHGWHAIRRLILIEINLFDGQGRFRCRYGWNCLPLLGSHHLGIAGHFSLHRFAASLLLGEFCKNHRFSDGDAWRPNKDANCSFRLLQINKTCSWHDWGETSCEVLQEFSWQLACYRQASFTSVWFYVSCGREGWQKGWRMFGITRRNSGHMHTKMFPCSWRNRLNRLMATQKRPWKC